MSTSKSNFRSRTAANCLHTQPIILTLQNITNTSCTRDISIVGLKMLPNQSTSNRIISDIQTYTYARTNKYQARANATLGGAVILNVEK